MSFDFSRLRSPIVQAPMAGGPSTPALAAAVSGAGGLGFLAAGYRTAAQVESEIQQTRALTSEAFGVNLFVPQPSAADQTEIARYAKVVAAEASRYDARPGNPHPDDDDWTDKVEVVLREQPAMVSFTFGAPDVRTIDRFRARGITTAVTVTTLAEALAAVESGADVLCVQGPDGGGHRGTFNPSAEPNVVSLAELEAEIAEATALPRIVAGGLSVASEVGSALAQGAVAAQVGTSFLRAEEAGTRPTHREALASPEFTTTAITKAFSGRYARGLLNDFMRDHEHEAPFGYPEVNQLTGPLRAAAAAANDPHRLHLWAGVGFRNAQATTAAAIVGMLDPRGR
jgi:nitronate monooxygenase